MRAADEIKRLAHERLQEAVILCNNDKYDGAFYLAGYSVELMLKAKVCEHLGIDNLFDSRCTIQGIADVRKAVKTHDIAVLLILSGLRNAFEIAKSTNKIIAKTHARLFDAAGQCTWNEQIRYCSVGTQKVETVRELIELLQHEEGLLQWIEQS